MSEEKAKKLADRAGSQAKNAVKNTGRAAKVAAEPVAETVVAEAQETAEKFEDTAHDAVQAARRVNVGMLGKISGDTGIGFLALSVAIYSGTIAYAKFRQVANGGNAVIQG